MSSCTGPPGCGGGTSLTCDTHNPEDGRADTLLPCRRLGDILAGDVFLAIAFEDATGVSGAADVMAVVAGAEHADGGVDSDEAIFLPGMCSWLASRCSSCSFVGLAVVVAYLITLVGCSTASVLTTLGEEGATETVVGGT